MSTHDVYLSRDEGLTGRLRYVTPLETTTKPPKLQQEYWVRDANKSMVEWQEWRDVPTVVEAENG